MNHTELTAKTTIQDIESKLDKNQNPHFKLSLRGFANCFYAFSFMKMAYVLWSIIIIPRKKNFKNMSEFSNNCSYCFACDICDFNCCPTGDCLNGNQETAY